MPSKLKLPKRYVRQILESFDIEFAEKRLRNDSGVVFRLKTGAWYGVIVNAYDTGTILIQGKGSNGTLEVALMKKLLEAAAAVVKASFD